MATERRGDIQGLHALAVILVVVYHTRLALPGGFIGVDVFFVISGFVITRVLVAELDRTGRIDYANFYLRRIRRILPALAALLLPVLLLGLWIGPIGGQVATSKTAMAAALFNANTYLSGMIGDLQTGYFEPEAELNALLHTWSLSVEEQFYLGFPLAVGLLWRSAGRRAGMSGRSAIAVGMAVLGVMSFVLSATLTHAADPLNNRGDLAFYLAPSRAWEFAAGAGVVFLSGYARRLTRPMATAFAYSGLALITVAAIAYDDTTAFPGVAALLPVTGTALLIAAGEGPTTNRVRALLEWRPVQWIGDLSYSWYLWHWPLIVFAAALWPGSSVAVAVAALVSVAPALGSYRLVESPIRFRPMPSRAATLRLAQACIIIPIVAGLLFNSGREAMAETPVMSDFDTTFAFHADVENGCDDLTPYGQRDNDDCTWPAESAAGLAFLIGDSNAGQMTEGFVHGMNAAGYTATVVTKSNCPFADLTLTWFGAPHRRCTDFVAQTTADVIAATPDLVVFASASDEYTTKDEFGFRRTVDGQTIVDRTERAAAWAEGLRRTIDAFAAEGIEVAIVHPIPKHTDWDPDECALALWSVSAERCTVTTPIATADEYRAVAVAAEAKAASGVAATIDMLDLLCPSDPCSALDDGFWRWRDRGHITVEQSRELASVFAALLEG